jgi:NhaA family Na+:H+ antiporter
MGKYINLKSFAEFFKSGSVGGFILLGCVLVSLAIANSGIGPAFETLLATEVGKEIGVVNLRYSVLMWINDGLMAIFFLLVGLEIKRELIEGELSSPAKALLPILAAVGGVVAPALIYYFFNKGLETSGGWGIPMATDIAFALAIISLLGKKVPVSLKIFLAALAIADDLMAILVIAVFYTTELHVQYLLYAAGALALPVMFNIAGFKRIIFYIIPGVFAWYFIHHSGIHATIAGVLTAMTVPTNEDDTESPLEKLEHVLVNPVNFLIMPIFALANTNIRLEADMIEGLFTPLGMGIVMGLVFGKPLGISVATWFAVKLGVCRLPAGAGWLQIIGVGMLAGIGFTMSIFISMLSFVGLPHFLSDAKFAVLVASLLSGILGSLLMSRAAKIGPAQ